MRRLICCLLLCLVTPWALAALDLNVATETELDALPGVGPNRAQAIIEHRSKNGPFASVEDLRNVKGIGDKTFADLKPLLTVGAGGGATRSEANSSTPLAVPASGGFPWWIAAVIVVVAVVVHAQELPGQVTRGLRTHHRQRVIAGEFADEAQVLRAVEEGQHRMQHQLRVAAFAHGLDHQVAVVNEVETRGGAPVGLGHALAGGVAGPGRAVGQATFGRGPGHFAAQAVGQAIGGIGLQETGDLHAAVLRQALAVGRDVEFIADHGRRGSGDIRTFYCRDAAGRAVRLVAPTPPAPA